MDNQHNYIDLQAAHMTQYTNDGVQTDWNVRKNITSDDLFTLPQKLTDAEAMQILDIARKFELIAWNEGIKFQKGKQNQVLVQQIKDLESVVKELLGENERITNILVKHLPKED